MLVLVGVLLSEMPGQILTLYITLYCCKCTIIFYPMLLRIG
jgi:hypothetical protein